MELEFIFFKSLQTLFVGLTRFMSNFCETAYILFSPLTFGVKSTDLPVFGSSIVHMQENANLNLKSIDIDTILLQNPENLLKIS